MAQVLVVDDDQGIRETLRLVLEDAGYEVAEAADGIAALRVLRASHRPLVVLLDLMMPRMNGYELLAAVAGDPLLATSHTFITLSASPRERSASSIAQLRKRIHIKSIEKPFDIDDVLDAVEQGTHQLDTSLAVSALDLLEPSRAHS